MFIAILSRKVNKMNNNPYIKKNSHIVQDSDWAIAPPEVQANTNTPYLAKYNNSTSWFTEQWK